ncbi:hypothetical protein FPV67DRAFT_1429869 [Lyophyllum atratum]|nr:hypothetical protein FPV67DRAFT_1429869 [Lyophyllum atratum]
MQDERFLFRFYRDSFTMFLASHGLLYNFETEVKVVSLINTIVELMQESEYKFQFQQSGQSSLLAHEVLPLQLLALPTRKDGQIRLKAIPLHDPELKLSSLASDKHRFNQPVCIEANRLVIHFGIAHHPVSLILNHMRHTCLDQHMARLFPHDNAGSLSSSSSSEPTCDCEPILSDSSSDFDVEMTDDEDRPWDLSNAPTQRRSSRLNSVSFSSANSFLPMAIWSPSEEWMSAFADRQGLYSVSNLASAVFEAANSSLQKLKLRGPNVSALATAFLAMIAAAGEQNDYTDVLSPDRSFTVTTSSGSTLSFGQGIERETVFTAFQTFTTTHAEWFNHREDSFATLQTAYSAMVARHIPAERLAALKQLGALCSIMMIMGLTPSPLDPSIFQFIVHGCDLHSLHPAFIGEWHPNLHQLILDWKQAGPTGNIQPFQGHLATYHDLQATIFKVSSLSRRTDASHNSMAAAMLYRAIMGPEDYRHPEWQAFISGCKLPCRNGHFHIIQVPRQFEGGSEAFFSVVWTSHISDFASLSPHLSWGRTPSEFTSALALVTDDNLSLQSIIGAFFQGSGLPSPTRFAEIKESFSPAIDLTKLDTQGFRPRMFAWAATGSPSLDPASDMISIICCRDDDPMYAGTAPLRAMMVSQGKISFRTCLRTARLPGSHILKLVRADYPDPENPEIETFQKAFDHWFLCEILNVIGRHSFA